MAVLALVLGAAGGVFAGPGSALAADLVGGLYVVTDPPEAAVYVNGELKGVSPCGIPDVAVGEVEITAEKQGFQKASRTIQVEANKTLRVDLALPGLANVGSLAVLVDPPGSDVEFDRVPRGRTPAVLLNVSPGTHRVVVSAAGFRPMYSTVTVAANQQAVLKGKLVSLKAPAAQVGAVDLERLGVLDEENVPATAEMPEERAFEPVRKLVSERRYEEALAALDRMAADEVTQQYARRIGSERRVTKRIREVVNAAYDELRRAKGQDYALSLRRGIRFAGRLVDVTDVHAVMSVSGGERRILLSSISAEHVVRLASGRMDPSQAADRASFAMLYAAEGEFEKAYDELRGAAATGYDIAATRSYVDSEHLWAAAVQKEQTERLRARVAGLPPAQRLSGFARPVKVLVDTYRGQELPEMVVSVLAEKGVAVEPLAHPLTAGDVEEPVLLVVRDPGEGRPVPAYDRQELQITVDFVRRGGGLLFVGAPRAAPQQVPGRPQRPPRHPFEPLLRWFGVLVVPGGLSVTDEAPEEYPRDCALCFPVIRHPVTYGVRCVVLPMDSPSLAVMDGSWVLLRASPFVVSTSSKLVGPAVVAARSFGGGRVLVVANMPLMNESAWEGSPFYANDANKLLLNGLFWLSEAAGSPERNAP
ncbi:MAG: PEGA domain-containing protein [Candidatus Brocadiae bacterium]|nr:PEGA domain-containing protein [Candidatus Brocadiia bacterium]